MNNDLLKRIDERFTSLNDVPVRDVRLTRDEWAQIRKYLPDCRAEIERKATYVPMTDDEIIEIADTAESNAFRMGSIVQETGYEGYRAIEAAVIKRLGLEVKQ